MGFLFLLVLVSFYNVSFWQHSTGIGKTSAQHLTSQQEQQILWFENYDLESIVTPVKAKVFGALLREAKYPTEKVNYIEEGFSSGFSLQYDGPQNVRRTAANLKLRIGNEVELWNKVMKEVGEKRYTGPFDEVPYEFFIQSPIGLVPKDGGTKTRLIFHLSYPRGGDSVNSGIDPDLCKVRYPDFDEAVKMCLAEGKSCSIGKSDMSSAFRQVPLQVQDFQWLILKAKHPKTGKIYYFVDKCLPFGSSISCAHFQAISDAIAYMVSHRTKKPTLNYLDDFFFAALIKMLCDLQIEKFIEFCKEISFPVTMEKTFWGTKLLVFLGLLLDTERQLICVPKEKVIKARDMISYFIDRKNKKATVLQFQQLCGYLNFLGRAIVPARAFTMRLYSPLSGFGKRKLRPHHHIRIKEENRLDLLVWSKFLDFPSVFCRPFIDVMELDAQTIAMTSDASGKIGFGATCFDSWMFGEWPKEFLKQDPSIEFLELYALLAGVLTWLKRFKNKRIRLWCDNIAVVHMVNNNSSTCKDCMVLIRLLVFESLKQNSRVYANYIKSKDNGLSDSLSRMDFDRFHQLGPDMEKIATEPPSEIWPVWKVWLHG